MDRVDVAVIGGGIAGVTAACHVAGSHSVVLLEQENELAQDHQVPGKELVEEEVEAQKAFHREGIHVVAVPWGRVPNHFRDRVEVGSIHCVRLVHVNNGVPIPCHDLHPNGDQEADVDH